MEFFASFSKKQEEKVIFPLSNNQTNEFRADMTTNEISKVIADKLIAEVKRQLGTTEPEKTQVTNTVTASK